MSVIKLGDCSGCSNTNVPIINRKRMLCSTCNSERLSTRGSSSKPLEMKAFTAVVLKKSSTPKRMSDKSRAAIAQDDKFYEDIWTDGRGHYCEECTVFLGDNFRDDRGKIVRYRYSHILGKGAYPMFRRRVENINLLCYSCHVRWESNDPDMTLVAVNAPVIEMLMNELKALNGRSE